MTKSDEWNLVETQAVLYEIPRDIFILQGEKTKQWCNGIFTNNIRSMQKTQFKYNAFCNDRGHVQGLANLLCLDNETFLCILEAPSLEEFNKRFSMFMILDDIELITKNTKIFSLQGTGHQEIFLRFSQQLALPYPSEGLYSTNKTEDIFCFFNDRSDFGGIDIIATTPQAQQILENIIQDYNIPIGTSSTLDALRITANKVRFPQDATTKSFVHELQINKACCAFDKGCYVGQEIINRMDIKGILNKRLTRILLDQDIDLQSSVFLDASSPKPIGKLTSKAQTPIGLLGLAILRKEAWEHNKKLHIKNEHTEVTATVYNPSSIEK